MSAKGQSGLPGPTHRSEKKRRYVVCNRDDISELWIELELCASKNIVDVQAQTADGNMFAFSFYLIDPKILYVYCVLV